MKNENLSIIFLNMKAWDHSLLNKEITCTSFPLGNKPSIGLSTCIPLPNKEKKTCISFPLGNIPSIGLLIYIIGGFNG